MTAKPWTDRQLGAVYEGKRVMVLGGLGFIGSNLAIRLADCGARVTVVDNLFPGLGGNPQNIPVDLAKITVIREDIGVTSAISGALKVADFIFNLAGQTGHSESMAKPLVDLELNVVSQLSFLEACRKLNPTARIVFASTRQIYGAPHYLPVDEAHPLNPVDVNGVNKVAGENFHTLYKSVYGLNSSVLRLTNTYGPRMRVSDAKQTFLGIWVRNALTGKPIEIFGDGEQLRDFTFVDDAVDAFLVVGASQETIGEVYNVGGEKPYSLNEIAKMLIAMVPGASSRNIPFPEDRASIDIGSFYADDSKLRAATGWFPRVPVEAGLRSCLRFYEKNGSSYGM